MLPHMLFCLLLLNPPPAAAADEPAAAEPPAEVIHATENVPIRPIRSRIVLPGGPSRVPTAAQRRAAALAAENAHAHETVESAALADQLARAEQDAPADSGVGAAAAQPQRTDRPADPAAGRAVFVMDEPSGGAPAAAGPAPAQPAGQVQPASVPIARVMLFSSGVGYFEHFGRVKGDSSATLTFKTEQINDILKSLILQDMDGGAVSTISYPSQLPLEKTLRSFGVDIAGNPSLPQLLNQLRGARVTVQFADQNLTGTVLGVETGIVVLPNNGGTMQRHTLNLLRGAIVTPVDLSGIRDLTFVDAQLQEELAKALAALAQARDQEKKPVTINFRGQGDRRVRFGYVVETPIWKTSYRLILPAKQDEKTADLQGWAIVENHTESDWQNIQLSLVSGRPISFIQDLYSPLFVRRPVVEPELFASLRPQRYAAGRDQANKAGEFGGRPPAAPAPSMAPGSAAGSGAAPRREMRARGAMAADADGMLMESMEALAEPMDATASVASAASAAALGELFEYVVGNVSLARQQSAMIPIVTDKIGIERLSIYNQSVMPRNPLNGLRIENSSGKHLLAGPITVLDAGAYAGDAQIENLPPGQKRLLSYGVDLKVTVDADKTATSNDITTGKIVRGVLDLTYKTILTREYVIDNKADTARRMLIEHPRSGGFELVETVKPVETTDVLYRFEDTVEPGKASKLTVKEQRIYEQRFALINWSADQVNVYVRMTQIPKPVRDALTEVARRRQAIQLTQRQIEEARQLIRSITDEQGRMRANMERVDRNSQYYQRLLTKLNDQETQIEQTQSKIEDLRRIEAQQVKDLEDYVAALNVG